MKLIFALKLWGDWGSGSLQPQWKQSRKQALLFAVQLLPLCKKRQTQLPAPPNELFGVGFDADRVAVAMYCVAVPIVGFARRFGDRFPFCLT
ncbi:hypothetical protein [Mesorhizobium argentiipisi]|uniref:Uncharacterized protein n=1 Tax=Mesorhizobium argentiipisi TaxID=3015175 RepID=A0ABU8K5B8_9HYPH